MKNFFQDLRVKGMVLNSSLLSNRFFYFSSPRKYCYARVSVCPKGDAIIPPFSGKVVKSLLIRGNDKLASIFESSGIKPKPIHISPLGFFKNNKLMFLWIKGDSGFKGPLTVSGGEEYFFHIGFEETIKHMVLGSLGNIDGVEVFNTKWYVLSYEYGEVTLPSESPPISLNNVSYVKVEFRSPINIVDPYKPSKFRRFLPTAGFLFSYNIGELARILQRNEIYWKMINIFNAALQETHNIWDTVKKIFYIYNGKKIPGLTGYVKYFLEEELTKKQIIRKLIENILTHAQIMGAVSYTH